MSKESLRKLYETAEKQHGFFTAAQARQAGYRDNVHPYHVTNGDWIRMARGIYRLERFPDVARPELDVMLLWTRNRAGIVEGAFSHRTALEIRGVVERGPNGVHMTVPASFRRNSKPPKGLVLHTVDLPAMDIEEVDGYRVVSLLRAVADLQENGAFDEVLAEVRSNGNGSGPQDLLGLLHEEPAPQPEAPSRPRATRARPKTPSRPKTPKRPPKPPPEPAPEPQPAEDGWGGARAW